MDLTYEINADEVIARFIALPEKMREAMTDTINILTADMQRSVVENKLTGQVLNVRIGTLRRSITQRPAVAERGGIWGGVYTNLNYGIAWEDGFDRKLGAGTRGGPRTLTGQALASYFVKHPPSTKHYERPYLKPTLEEFSERIIEDVRKTALEVIRGT